MTILGCPPSAYRKKLARRVILMTVVSVAVVALNALLCALRSDRTHEAFAAINIALDVAALWTAYALTVSAILPGKKRLDLFRRGERTGKKLTAAVTEVSDKTTCVRGFVCRKVVVSAGGGREFYLIDKTFPLEKGRIYEMTTVENLICAAEEAK